ncbi:MAG TPA: tetratricopeptide repeat protein [Chthoniobacteraceae bacterium]|nr:tetratricopeptide repeat protein [Chthoniobacteraceae bacterium]
MATEPLLAQQWMERFLRERDARETTRREEERRRSTPPPEATSLRDVTRAQENRDTTVYEEPTPTPEPEVRKALPVAPAEDGVIEPFQPRPESRPAEARPETRPEAREEAAPAPEATEETIEWDPNLPVRRAEPVVRATPAAPEKAEDDAPAAPSAAAVTPENADDAAPETTPEPPRERRLSESPREALEAPVNIVPNAQPQQGLHDGPATVRTEIADEEGEAEATAAATPASHLPPSATSEQLDPRTNEIRLTPGASSAPADQVQFSYANHYYARKDYFRAIAEFERYLSLQGTAADRQAALFRLAESYRQTGSYNSARKNYENLIFTYQTGDFIGPASYRLAELCYQQEDYSAAVTFFRKASVWLKDPTIVLSAQFFAARSLERLKFESEAIQAYEEVITHGGENPFREAAQLALVELYTKAQRRNQALRILDALREGTAKPAIKAEATARIGILLLELNENAEALKELQAALKMPEIGAWREISEIGLLRILYNQGKYQEVVDTYDKSEKKFSKTAMPEVLLVVGNSYRQLDKADKAGEFYDRIATDYGDTPYAAESQYERLVTLYSSDSPKLIEEIDAYLEANPEEGPKRDQLVLMKAEAYYKTKRYVAAAPVYASLRESSLSPALKAETLFKLGWCQVYIGDHPAAIQSFTEFLNEYPTNKLTPAALAQRGFCYEKMRNYTAALHDFDEIIRTHRKAKEREFALQHKALILGQQDESRGMMEAFERLLKEYPESHAAGQAHYWIGLTAYQARDYRKAVEMLSKARSLDKEFNEKSTLHIIAALRHLEDRKALAAEIDQAGPKTKLDPELLRWLGTESLKAGEAGQATRYLTRLTESEKADAVIPEDWLNLGRAQTQNQEWEKAEASITHYLSLATEPVPQADGYLALADAQIGHGRFDQALQSARRVQDLQPEGRLNALGKMRAGDVAKARNDFDGAAKLFLSVSILYEDPVITPQALEKAYLCFKKSGDQEKAAKTLNDLQTRYPEYQINLASTRQ